MRTQSGTSANVAAAGLDLVVADLRRELATAQRTNEDLGAQVDRLVSEKAALLETVSQLQTTLLDVAAEIGDRRQVAGSVS